MSRRIEKVNKLIQHLMAEIIEREIDLKTGVLITVSQVDTTPDMRYTRVFVSVLPPRESQYVMKTLEHEIYPLQRALNKKLHMRILPRVSFVIDDREEKANQVEQLFKEIEK